MKKFFTFIQIILLALSCLIFSCCATAPATTAKGSAWLSGSGIPAADAGEVGDYYLDFETSAVYEKTADGWTVRGNLKPTVSEEKVTVTFDANGGELPAGYLRENVLKKGDSFVLPVPTRSGYAFLGWFYGEGANGGQADDLTVFARDVLLTAKWRKLHVLSLTSRQTELKLGEGAFQFSGEYDGSEAAKFTLFLEKNGVRDLAEESGWVSQPIFRFLAEEKSLNGVLNFLETGNYRVIVVAEEDGEQTEASITISVVSE